MTLICLDPCQWSLMSLITGNLVKSRHRLIEMYLVLAIAIVGNMYGVIAFVDFKKEYVGDFPKNEDFSFSENNLNIK